MKGFTLIELLIVVVIIGILAAIAIPKFAATKQRAYVAAVKTDLKNLATAEEGYASANNGNYFVSTGTIGPTAADTLAGFAFAASQGVKITLASAAAGWSATALHTSVPSMTTPCAIFYNTAPVSPAVSEGVPACAPGF
ncbi:MAG TPA: prepilin-type N-terminal cleavage/methylation domain-containing protein [Gemmatimonadaceae bacterium]